MGNNLNQLKIFSQDDNLYDAIDVLVNYGVVAIEGTKSQATEYSDKLIKCLESYEDIDPIVGYLNVPTNGYLYYIHDSNKFFIGDSNLKKMVLKIDKANPI